MTGTWILRPLALTFTAALAVAVLPASAATSTASPLGAVTSVPSVAEQTPATGSEVVKDVTAPTWASGARLLASVGGTNRIVVTWPAARDNVKVTGYVLYRGTRQVGTASAGVRTFGVTGLPAGTRVTVTVRAKDAAGNLSRGISASATTARVPTTPGAEELISAAVQARKISAEVALRYEVFSAFGDARVPVKYRGSARVPGDVVAQVRSRWSTLSLVTRNLLAPFLLPPAAKGSWYAKHKEFTRRVSTSAAASPAAAVRPAATVACSPADWSYGWTSVAAAGGKVRFWYQKNLATWTFSDPRKPNKHFPTMSMVVNAVARGFTTLVWPRIVQAMGPPKPDKGGRGNLCQGPDSAIDVYFLHSAEGVPGALVPVGYAVPYDDVGPTSGFIELPLVIPPEAYDKTYPSLTASLMAMSDLYVLAHEFMHIVLLHFTTDGRADWLSEATATWSEDLVFPWSNNEHRSWKPARILSPLNDGQIAPLSQSPWYQAYSWPLMLARSASPQAVAAMWQSVSDAFTAARRGGGYDALYVLRGIDDGVPGGFDAEFPKYAAAYWNQADQDQFSRWDSMPGGVYSLVADRTSITGAVDSGGLFDGHAPIDPVSAAYEGYKLSNAKARYLTVGDPAPDQEHSSGEVIYRTAGSATWLGPVTIPKGGTVSFCRDKPEENVTEFVVVLSNNGFDGTKTTPGGRWATNDRCPRALPNTWQGTTTAAWTWTAPDGGDLEAYVETVTVSGTGVAFDLASRVPTPEGDSADYVYRAGSGAIRWVGEAHWTQHTQDGVDWTTCSADAHGTVTPHDEDPLRNGVVRLFWQRPPTGDEVTVEDGGIGDFTGGRYSCGDGSSGRWGPGGPVINDIPENLTEAPWVDFTKAYLEFTREPTSQGHHTAMPTRLVGSSNPGDQSTCSWNDSCNASYTWDLAAAGGVDVA